MKKLIIASIILVIVLGCAGLFLIRMKDTVAESNNPEGTRAHHTFNDPTGVCYRKLQWSQGGELHSRYEVVLVRQSSSLEKDMERLKEADSTNYHFRNPDTTPFMWVGALIDDTNAAYGTPELDCSGLPSIAENRH